MASNSNTGAPRLSVEIGAITTDLKKGLADARAEIQKFNKELSKSEYKNVLDAERLATQKARTEAVKFASDLKSSLSESLNNAKIYTENARKATEDYRQSLLSNKSALEQSKVATEQQRQATEAERTALANSRSELARIALEKRKGQQVTIALAGSYREAQQRLTALGNTIKNAEGGFNSKSRAIRAQINEYNQLNNKLKDFDRQMGNNQRNVGNYPQLLSSIPVIGQLTSAVGALAVAQQGLSKSFSTNLRFDALTTALKNISGDSETFGENMRFLESISDRLGLSFIATADAFKMWQGSAKFSNLTADESRRIFESVANASAKMKLSQDQTSGAFLALSQMMSKGKVQAEELRGQLGERLPGAFNLAAKAMGVTEAELNKMLETGQVVANDFLPKFATQLDKSFGNDKTEKIESMQASLNRLNNEFDKLFLSDNGKSFFQNTMDGFSNLLAEINDVSNGVSRANGWFDIFYNSTQRANKPVLSGKPLNESDFAFTNIAKGAKDTSTAYNLVTKAVEGNNKVIVKNKTYWEEQVKSLKAVRDAMNSADVGTKKWIETTNKLKQAQSQVALFSTAKSKSTPVFKDFSSSVKDVAQKSKFSLNITESEGLEKELEKNRQKYKNYLDDLDKLEKQNKGRNVKNQSDTQNEINATRKQITNNQALEEAQIKLKYEKETQDAITKILADAGVDRASTRGRELEVNKNYYDELAVKYKQNADVLLSITEARKSAEAGINKKWDDKIIESNSKTYDKISKIEDKAFTQKDNGKLKTDLDKRLKDVEEFYDGIIQSLEKAGIKTDGITTAMMKSFDKVYAGYSNQKGVNDAKDNEFTKEFQSTLRRGLSSTFNEFFSSLGSMSNASYDIEKKYSDLRRDASAREIVALNEMERLEKSINNGLTNTLSKIGATFSQIGGNLLSSALSTGIAKGDFKDLAKLFSGDSKAIGYGALGSLAGSALGSAFKPTDTVGQGLSGALSGAGTGVAIGSIIPGIGTVAGAIGGALIGGLSSLLGSSKAKKQEELAQKQYEEQKKQTLLMERQAQLTYQSQVIGVQTANGAVTSIERNEFGELVANIKGSDIDLVLKRYNSSRG